MMREATASPYKGWRLFICGMCMGAADLIPGISGGTIAFILGFYQPLIESLKSLNWFAFQHLLKGEWRKFGCRTEWLFLLTLISGIAFAIASLARPFHSILSDPVYRIYFYGIFFGLILASFLFCAKKIQNWSFPTVCAFCAGAAAAFFLTESTISSENDGDYAVPIEIESTSVHLSNYDDQRHLLTGLSPRSLQALAHQGKVHEETPVFDSQGRFMGFGGDLIPSRPPFLFNVWLILCGSLAACALLLPGVSGSYILTLLGVYPLVIEALADFLQDLTLLSFNGDACAILFSLGVGIVLGGLCFARGVSWLLKHYPCITLALLSGFMIGAIRSVWPFWTYDYMLVPFKLAKGPQLIPLEPFMPSFDSLSTWKVFFCSFSSFLIVFGLESFAGRKEEPILLKPVN